MKDVIYLYSENSLLNIIHEILLEYSIVPLTLDEINNMNFKNNNVLIVSKNNPINEIKESFLLSNNVVFFLPNKQISFDETKTHNANFFYGQSSVKKFFDEIKTYFIAKTLVLKNTELFAEKITNIDLGLSVLLTPLENKILIVLFENKKIERDYLLEEILKIKKNIETKTIESHLTRIRRKLLRIESEIQIKSKDDIFYLQF